MDKKEIDKKVKSLMLNMTLEEKVLQLTGILAMDISKPETLGLEDGIGSMPVMGGSPVEIAENIKKVQDYVLEHSKNKIPVLFHCEALSGPLVVSGNLFPASIGLGATFAPEIVKDMAERNREQMKALGIRQALSPVIDVTRDLRWGRLGETYGGDPTLCGAMATAFVEGMQGEDLREGVAATGKHFLGYSSSLGGLNMSRVVADYRDLRESFAKPFEMAIQMGNVKSIMNSYNEYNGKPVCASKELLTDLLRDDLGFEGVTVSDYSSVERVDRVYRASKDLTDAGERCLEAGLDVELPNRVGYNKEMTMHAKEGKFDKRYIDRAVERVLRLKYELGLFENPYPRTEELEKVFENSLNNKKSLEATMKTMTLTKNEGILPITNRKKKIAVVGPMANAVRAFYACYTVPASMEMMIKGESAMAGVETPENMANNLVIEDMDLHIADDAIRAICPDVKTTYEALCEEFEEVVWSEGCDYIGDKKNNYQEAVETAQKADIVIMAVGGRNGWGTYCTSGEGADSTQIGLPGNQEELVKKIYAVNQNMVIVHTDCRPLVSEWIYDYIPAILEAWLPCTYGGIAIAKTITGENVPGGRLPMDVPRNSSHGPVGHYFYRGTEHESFSQLAINKRGYLDIDMRPRLMFGYGLSYTTFEYINYRLDMDSKNNVTVCVDVKNTGQYEGDEVVQLYGIDKRASIVRPAEELIGFKRISLKSGEKKRVEFRFNIDILSYFDDAGRWIVEAGEFEFYIGKDSKDIIWKESIYVDNTYEVEHRTRTFIANSKILIC